jgi:tetratricopeptide (TPR) repeat protein
MALSVHSLLIMVCAEIKYLDLEYTAGRKNLIPPRGAIAIVIIAMLLPAAVASAQGLTPTWQAQVRIFAELHDWPSAMSVIDQQLARAPQDMDVRAWRARILVWSERLAEAETEYLDILKISPTDPDDWLGLANLYFREGKIQEAQRSISIAEDLDPQRADVHAARARILRAAGEQKKSRLEFETALKLDPANTEAHIGLMSMGAVPKHELRIGQDEDRFNFTAADYSESVLLASQWTAHWATSVSGNFYQRDGINAGKFLGSVTRREANWGALTVGGGVSHDHAIIPRSESFFELDHGWRISETNFVSATEFVYGQHWYWYQGARILTLRGMLIVSLPREWTFSVASMGSRSAFSGTGAEWRPSGMARLGFPLARRNTKQLAGNVFFGAGTEDFAQINQIGRFASQTYGSGLRFQLTKRQDLTGYAAYQKRTQDRSDTNFGWSYGIHF